MSYTQVYRFQNLPGYESVISKGNSDMTYMGFARILLKAGESLEYTVTNHRFVSAVLHYPNSVKYAVVPLSMALMVIKSLERTILDFKKLMKNG